MSTTPPSTPGSISTSGASSPHPDHVVFQLLGESGLRRIVDEFYAQIPTDDLLGPIYAQHLRFTGTTMEAARIRLSEFLIYRFGGPDRYLQERGHPRLRARHMPFTIDSGVAERWIQLMDNALERSQVPPQAATILRGYFRTTALFMVNQ